MLFLPANKLVRRLRTNNRARKWCPKKEFSPKKRKTSMTLNAGDGPLFQEICFCFPPNNWLEGCAQTIARRQMVSKKIFQKEETKSQCKFFAYQNSVQYFMSNEKM